MATIKPKVENGSQKSSEAEKMSLDKYATKKTLAEGLLDISLLMANASQLKAILNAGSSVDYYTAVVVLIAVSIFLQTVVAGVLLILGKLDCESPKGKKCADLLNDCSVAFIATITVINVFISAFGIKISE